MSEFQSKGEAKPLPMPELRFFVSDYAVNNSHGAFRHTSTCSLQSSDAEETSNPVNEIVCPPDDPPVSGLDSLDSLCSVISAITLPGPLACNKQDSHNRFQHSTHSAKQQLTDKAPPRFPTRQGSRTTLESLLAFEAMSSTQQRSDTSPKKPKRRSKKQRVAKSIRKFAGSICSSRFTISVQGSVVSEPVQDYRPKIPFRRTSAAFSA